MTEIIINILKSENINYKEENINQIIQNIYNYSVGDLRKAITILQRAVYISNINYHELNGELIDDISGIIPKEIINNLYKILKKNNESYQSLINIIIDILNSGYSSSNILNELSIKMLNDINIDDSKKSKIFIKMSDISNLLSSGSGDYIQLLSLCSFINFTINN